MKVKQIMPDFFLIRVSRKKQKELKEKVSGSSLIYQDQRTIFHTKNLEHGTIVQIGSRIKKNFPECIPGHTLIVHWSVESDMARPGGLLYQDKRYSYFAVAEKDVMGYYDGETIHPTNNFIFLKNISAIEEVGDYDPNLKTYIKKTDSGLILYSNWEASDIVLKDRIEYIKKKIESLSKSRRTEEVQREIERYGAEMNALNRKRNPGLYLPYKVAYSNHQLNRDCGTPIKEDDIVFCFNKACLYICNFKISKVEYIICRTEYVAFVDNRRVA